MTRLAVAAIDLAEISAPDGPVPRRDVTRLLRKLYGPIHKKAPLQRWLWRTILSEYFGARVLGSERARWDEQEERRKKAKEK